MSNNLVRDCFHCHLPIPKGFLQSLIYQTKQRYFCCMGCFSIAETIIDNGLDDYYKFRTASAEKASELVPTELEAFDQQEVQEQFVSHEQDSYSSINLICSNLQCSACSWLIEKRIGQLDSVKKVMSNVTEQTIQLHWDNQEQALSEILIQFHQLGYPVKPYQQQQAELMRKEISKSWLKRLGLAGLGMMQVMMYAVALYIGAFDGIEKDHRDFLRLVSFLVATPVLIYAGYPFFSSAFRGLKNVSLNMDVPIALALFLAYMASVYAMLTETGEVYFDSVTMFIFFLLIGRYLEYQARQKVQQQFASKELDTQQLVDKVSVKTKQVIATLPVQNIEIGDLVLIKPGAKISFDGVLVEGESSVNEAMLSGEFMPVNKGPNDKVLAASINGEQSLLIKVTHLYKDGFMQRLSQLQRLALLEKSKLTMLADKVARYFIAAILLIAIFTLISWWHISTTDAIWITISVLVISCPCALSLATPVALTCAISSLNKRNFLIQEQDFMQKLEKTTDIIFDKTGTLTEGVLSLDQIETYHGLETSQALKIIAALEQQSEHPIAKVFASYLDENVIAEKIKIHPYAGVNARVDGDDYYFGNAQFITDKVVGSKKLAVSALYLFKNKQMVANLLLKDTLRKGALEACQILINNGKQLHLLSGDPSEQVAHLAQQLDIDNWHKGVKPVQKLDYIKSLKSSKEPKVILMVGDGVNDAPAMALSDLSIAMEGASEFTKNHADSYLFSANLTDIKFAIEKSKQTNRIIKQNLAWAFFYNLIMLPFAILGLVAPYLAAIGMSLSSMIVVINSLRLKTS